MQTLSDIRHYLHSIAELSGYEKETNCFLNNYLKSLNPDLLIERIGGYGVAAIFAGEQPGKRVLIRGDIDALRIAEPNEIAYRSVHKEISHKCGHDGHTAILCGLARELSECRPEKGEVVILFQPAEETGEGAAAVIADSQFARIKPDVAYGLHNLPGFPIGTVALRKGCFAAASFGMKLVFDGKTAHASQPETGRNPSELFAQLIHQLEKKRDQLKQIKPLTTFVITHAFLGEPSFGIAPGHAEIWLTLRSFADNNLELLATQIIDFSQAKAKDYLFDFSFSMHEAFAATNGTDENIELIERSANNLELNVIHLDEPFRWSEDFGRFGAICPIGFFGLGSGVEQPALHNANYDFPDDVLPFGVGMFWEIIRQELMTNK